MLDASRRMNLLAMRVQMDRIAVMRDEHSPKKGMLTIQRAFTGEPEALQDAVVTMFDLKYAAGGLLGVALGDGPKTAGPVFGPGARSQRRAGRK